MCYNVNTKEVDKMTTVTIRLDDLDMRHCDVLKDYMENDPWIDRGKVSRTDVIRQALRIAAVYVDRQKKNKKLGDPLIL